VGTLIERDVARFERTPGFALSVVLHLVAIVAVLIAPQLVAPEGPRPIFNREIKPFAEHLIWYNLRKKLPEVKPAETADAKPPRAHRIFQQQIVARQIELPRPPQLIRVPAPEIRLVRPLNLPNVLAAAPPRPVRPFAPPPLPTRPAGQTPLPAAPQLKQPAAPREFTLMLSAPRPQPLPFIPPTPHKTEPRAPSELPAAPAVAVATPEANMPRIPHAFSAPVEKKAKPAATDDIVLANDEAPVAVPASPQSTLAIVGLAPIDTPAIPKPPGAHEAGFSAGPHRKLEGGAAAPAGASVVVPGLMAHGGAHDAGPAVIAAVRPLTREDIVAEMMAGRTAAQPATAQSGRIVKAPDPRLAGRAVYTISIQMPNVTSYSGSWLVWFAERRPPTETPPSNMQSPVALRKVDPKYYRDTIIDRIEGTVRLFAVIRKDGQVDAIEILHGIDSRLDRSAAEALAKWRFEPAKREGVPVDVDAVFEVPFRLAPKSER